MTQQQEPMARSLGGPKTKTGQGKDRARTGKTAMIIGFYNLSYHAQTKSTIIVLLKNCCYTHKTLLQ
jgi:hypothetical protein